MNKRRWTIWLDDDDRAIIARLRRRYGQSSDSATIRLALRLAGEEDRRAGRIDSQIDSQRADERAE